MTTLSEAPQKSKPLTGKTAEADLHQIILDERLDDEILDYLIPTGKPHLWESSLWDYKREAPNTSGRDEKEGTNSEIAELVKDVVSFYNSFGGFIVFGVDQQAANQLVGCGNLNVRGFTVEKLNQQVLAYTKCKINCRFKTFEVGVGDLKQEIGILMIPMRPVAETIVRMARGAPETGGRSPVFTKGEIFARIGDECRRVQLDLQALQFVCSARKYGEISPVAQIEDSLPPADPNLIRFVGRGNYLLELWSWVTNNFTPIKVLTALGGTGKTSIAYEFASQIVDCPPANIAKVVWLTAKKKSFSAISGQWFEMSRTDFDNVSTFFEQLALQLGATQDEVDANQEREEMFDLVLEVLGVVPAFVVVDDIDSLELAQQAELFSALQMLSGRAFNTGTKFLLTSRLDLGAGSQQQIAVSGFDLKEFTEYAKMVAEQRHITLNEVVIQRLHRVSLGSPVFCASILRLASLGTDVNSAITQWKDKAGEIVREFAFARELEQLSDSQARTLFALCTLGETTQLELKQVLNVTDIVISADLAKLREYHLFASKGDPGTGTKLEVPEPIKLMGDVLRKRIMDPKRIETDCARARKVSPSVSDKVALEIGSINALIKAKDFDAALLSAQRASRENPKSGDLLCMLGVCYMRVRPLKQVEADRAFRNAYQQGCTRQELVNNWFELKRMTSDWNGIVDLVQMIPPGRIKGGSAVTQLNALLHVADQYAQRNDYVGALERYKAAMETAQKIVEQGRAIYALSDVRERCRNAAQKYVMLSERVYSRPGDKLSVFNAVIDAFNCYITETWIIDTGLESIKDWAKDVASRPVRDQAGLDILQQKVIDLKKLEQHIRKSGLERYHLLCRVESALNTISTYLQDHRKKG